MTHSNMFLFKATVNLRVSFHGNMSVKDCK